MRSALYTAIIAALLSYAVQNIWFMSTDIALMLQQDTCMPEVSTGISLTHN